VVTVVVYGEFSISWDIGKGIEQNPDLVFYYNTEKRTIWSF